MRADWAPAAPGRWIRPSPRPRKESSPCGNRTRLSGVRGRCHCRSTNGLSCGVRRAGVEPAMPGGGWVTATWARQCPADADDPDPMARVGVEPTGHRGLSSAAMPVRVPCRPPAPPRGFEPLISSLTTRRALRAAPRGRVHRSTSGPGGSRILKHPLLRQAALPVCLPGHPHRDAPIPGAGPEPTDTRV